MCPLPDAFRVHLCLSYLSLAELCTHVELHLLLSTRPAVCVCVPVRAQHHPRFSPIHPHTIPSPHMTPMECDGGQHSPPHCNCLTLGPAVCVQGGRRHRDHSQVLLSLCLFLCQPYVVGWPIQVCVASTPPACMPVCGVSPEVRAVFARGSPNAYVRLPCPLNYCQRPCTGKAKSLPRMRGDWVDPPCPGPYTIVWFMSHPPFLQPMYAQGLGPHPTPPSHICIESRVACEQSFDVGSGVPRPESPDSGKSSPARPRGHSLGTTPAGCHGPATIA